jgi:glycine/D-amino acid oxidase-like deaminating enzyme
MNSPCSTDIVLFGGGIAGLWLLNRLRNAGYSAVLLEADSLGGAQTLASQGIIHGGLKYALGGSVTDAANAIAQLPARWRACFEGSGEIDLSGCEVLSDTYYMWSGASYRSKLKAFFGSKSLQGRVTPVPREDFPAFFADATVGGSLYALPDFAVDTPSLLRELHRRHSGATFKIDAANLAFDRDTDGKLNAVSWGTGVSLQAQRFIFCAGKGNQDLIDLARLSKPASQLRPLKMVWLKKAALGALYAHCIGEDFSMTPRLTVTTHPIPDGRDVWYLGGELAEAGVGVPDHELIERARCLLADLFPWVDLAGAEWGCLAIDRAEAKNADGSRPDGALFVEEGSCIAAWPTKLTLTPALADGVLEALNRQAIAPLADDTAALNTLAQHLPPATQATPRWE